MPDPARRQPAWLDGLAPDGVVLRATSLGTARGLYFMGIAAFGALFVILTLLRNGNLLIAAVFGAAALWIGATGLKMLRQGLGGLPILAYDSAGLYVPGPGCIRWADIRRIRLHQVRRSFTIALDLEQPRRARLSLPARLRAEIGHGDVSIAGGTLPVSIKNLLDAIDPYYHAATGRHVSD
jgi:hypothetical protein